MKQKLVASLCVFVFVACSNNDAKSVSVTQDSGYYVNDNLKEIQVNGRFQVSNELSDDDVKILVYETNQLKDGAYYFQVVLKNNSAKSLNIQMEQIVLVDQYGEEYNAGLVDFELLHSIDPYSTVKGIVGFEGVQTLIPSYLKLKKLS